MYKEDKPPKKFTAFTDKHPAVAEAYWRLSGSVQAAGPLDEKTRMLIKIAISGGAHREEAFRVHVRKARLLGVSWDEITHVALLTMPSTGFHNTNALLSKIADLKTKEKNRD